MSGGEGSATLKKAETTEQSQLLNAEAILGADDIRRERVEVPEWGGHVYVQTMTGTDRDAYEMSLVDPDTGESRTTNLRAKLVARCLVDEAGNRLLTDDQVDALGRKSAAALDRCFDAAARLSKISNEDIDRLGKG